jgi:putative membrane protein
MMNHESLGRRQHGLAALYAALNELKTYIFPFLLFIFFQWRRADELNVGEIWGRLGVGFGVFLLIAIYGLLKWLMFRYQMQDGQLIVRQGIFVRKETIIPIERVQSVDISEGLLHRLTGTVKLQVQTSGGQKPEAVLIAVSREEALVIQRNLLETFVTTESINVQSELTVPTAPRLRKLSKIRLLLIGCTAGGLGIGLALFGSIAYQLVEFVPLRTSETVVTSWFSSLTVIFIIVIFLLVLAWFVSVVLAIIRFGNYTISRNGERLTIVRGIIERRQVTIPINRIQAIRLEEEPIWQWLGFLAVHAVSKGYGQEQEETTLLFPLLRRAELIPFLQEMVPAFAEMRLDSLHRLPRRSRVSYFFLPIFCLGLVMAGVLPFTHWGWLGGIVLAGVIFHGLWRHRSAGFHVSDQMLMMRNRFWKRKTLIVPRQRIQLLECIQTPLSQRNRHAILQIAVASGGMFSGLLGFRFRIRGMDIADIDKILDWWRTRISST